MHTVPGWQQQIFSYLPSDLRDCLQAAAGSTEGGDWREIRLRVGVLPSVIAARGEIWIHRAKETSAEEIREVLHRMSRGSYYTLEKEFRQGSLTLPGGHRVGMSGQMVFAEGSCQGLRAIHSLNIRIAREHKGAARELAPHLFQHGRPLNVLIFSSPGAGKTTMLRDLARMLAMPGTGMSVPAVPATFRVGIVDERSEIAGSYQGIPQLDVGRKSDVLDGCPKAMGMQMLLRSMNPEILITDEIGRPEDVDAVAEALRCGVAVITTAHAGSLDEIRTRPWLKQLVESGCFDRYVLLVGRPRPGTIAGVWGKDFLPLEEMRAWTG